MTLLCSYNLLLCNFFLLISLIFFPSSCLLVRVLEEIFWQFAWSLSVEFNELALTSKPCRVCLVFFFFSRILSYSSFIDPGRRLKLSQLNVYVYGASFYERLKLTTFSKKTQTERSSIAAFKWKLLIIIDVYIVWRVEISLTLLSSLSRVFACDYWIYIIPLISMWRIPKSRKVIQRAVILDNFQKWKLFWIIIICWAVMPCVAYSLLCCLLCRFALARGNHTHIPAHSGRHHHQYQFTRMMPRSLSSLELELERRKNHNY